MQRRAATATVPANPAVGLWKRFLVLVPLVVVLGIASYLHIRSVSGTYTAVGNLDYTEEELATCTATFSQEGVVEIVNVQLGRYGAPLVTFRALRDGHTTVQFGRDNNYDFWDLEVRDGGILQGGVDFAGWEAILISACIVFAVLAALFASVLVRLWRASWYGYEMVASGGGMLFFLFQLSLFAMFVLRNSERGFDDLAYDLTVMADYFVYLSIPAMAVLMLLVSISNISLIRHEGLRPVNLLGVSVSVVWVLVTFAWHSSGSVIYQLFSSLAVLQFLNSIMSSAIAFGECLLLSTMVCAWLAARHVPKAAVDYLVILGCGIRADGTPCPLLAGRVDKALAFDKTCVQQGDAPATFVPSGGQGPDEVMSEAQSMGNYLQNKGVEASRIVLEDKSTTTRENMVFSREVIERHAGKDASEVRIAFSTTNYHVFRGYVCAHQAGMAVEGMGSKTKAYFWPNAFLREFVGLLANQRRGILQTYLVIVLFYLVAEWALMMR
ncbi:MAG: YdcF family protein [Coriobacteriales bacterium]|nr:YdcF family protein [Coriobacteriales bacterium]